MSSARTAARGSRWTVAVALLVLGAALVGVLVDRPPATSSSSEPRPSASAPAPPPARAPGGDVARGAAVVGKLDPDLRDALRRAAAAAAGDGVEWSITSGWRSPAHQERLLREAVAEYGSEEEAARWVASPETSAHVSGDAVDLGTAAAAWLSEHGAAYGICQVYDNEPWHYELRPEAVHGGCPPTYADPTQDPRMQGR